MAISKSALFNHLKTLAKPHLRLHTPPSGITTLRFLSFATPEDAATERRKRKRRLRMEPPVLSPNRSHPESQSQPKPFQNPNAPKLPEPVSALSGNRLILHNRILTLIRQNDLEEAALFTRHSVYSNCRPTIFTVNSVMAAQLRQSKYSELLSLHRFITQAGIAANIITYNLIFETYFECHKPDIAMEHYKQFSNNAPINPSPSTYRILIKGLVEHSKLDQALELKEEMREKGFEADPIVYHYLMTGCVRSLDSDGVFKLFKELKEKLGGVVEDGVVYGNLMKGYFIKGMGEEAMNCYREAVGENSRVKMSAFMYNSVLDALSKNGKFDEAMRLFDRMMNEHNPPMRLAVSLGSFNVMVDGYFAEGRYTDAIEVFRKMGDYRCNPDTLSFNNLIQQLCESGMLDKAEEVYGEMGLKEVNPDEFTYVLLMDACFKENRTDDAAGYFRKMVEAGLRPNLAVYNRLADGLVKAGKIDDAKLFFDMMVKKLKMDDASYKFMMKALSESGKLDEVLKIVHEMLDDERVEFSTELQEFVKEELSKEGREDELVKLMEVKDRQKAEAKAKEIEAAEAAKRNARIAVSSLLPSKLFGIKESGTETNETPGIADEAVSLSAAQSKEDIIKEATPVEDAIADGQSSPEEVIEGTNSAEAIEARKYSSTEHVTT